MDLTKAIWHKASMSGNNGGNCVEVATNLPGVVAVRDSKNRQGPALAVGTRERSEFVHAVKNGKFRP